MSQTDLDRDLIRSARIQFSPTTQSVKSSALDKIVEQSIGLYGGDGLTVDDIVRKSCVVSNGSEIPVVRHGDVGESIRRLTTSGRVKIACSTSGTYALTELSRAEFDSVRHDSVRRAQRIVRKLFEDQVPDARTMVEPFFEILGRVFSRLGTSYVLTLKGDRTNVTPVARGEIASAISAISTQYDLSEQMLLRAAIQFFAANDPDSVTIKWNLAQNFYVALALGLDSTGTLLSDELIGQCALYLDTNVVVEGLDANARFHGSFKALVKTCKGMGVIPRVWAGTLRELDRVVNHYVDVISRAADRIPAESMPKVRGLFFEKFRDATHKSDDVVDLRKLFANFFDARRILSIEHGIEIEDDSADADEAREYDLERDVAEIMDLYTARRRGRKKGRLSAIHDATIVEKAALLSESGSRCFVVTLDQVLADIRLRRYPAISVAIGLDAFLQWISPFAGVGQGGDFAEIFSSALSSHLFPEETFFEISDFLIFADIDLDTKQLPAQDVEDCVHHLKRVAHQLDPSKPADRERLHGEIARFFADPGRKYHEKLHDMAGNVEAIRSEGAKKERYLREELAGRVQRVEELESQLKNESSDRDKLGKMVQGLTEKVDDIETGAQEREESLRDELANSVRSGDDWKEQFEEERRERGKEALKSSTRARLWLLFIVWITSLGAVGIFAELWGEGDNLYQRVLGSWELLVATAAIPVGLAYPFLGKERVSTLSKALQALLRVGSR